MPHWIMHLPCTADDAARINAGEFALNGDAPPALVTDEIDAATDAWTLTAYFEHEPSAAEVAAVYALLGRAADPAIKPELLPYQDWVTLSQQGLRPIETARFHVHSAHFPPHADRINFLIDAGQAFGTGHHGTTLGCLRALERWAETGKAFGNIVDLGTGTGLLAFAARALWPGAHVLASDIDPVAIEVAAENAQRNGVPLGAGAGAVALLVADGADAAAIRARAPYDLIIANILAEPLIALAPAIAPLLAADGLVLLSGLLTTQAQAVRAAYQACGMVCIHEATENEWSILELAFGST
ncbi:MAG: 50S ribosomal protein L11 methyltransferase [Alphaproteobacteria bacterium]|nr:50S ribosomal protein L11 methyltransferase [Alphaproteobacteria bacterium]MDE2340248.1 50S ribosomal protein L11 methyltransferase [Alphaproteobacteria bacterium]